MTENKDLGVTITSVNDVVSEVLRARKKYPNNTNQEFLTVLTEEFLELMRAINDKEGEDRIYDEATQVAACAIRIMEEFKVEEVPMKSDVPAALDLAMRFGQIDGDHHKAWVIDQMVRALTGDSYTQLVKSAKMGVDGPDSYGWNEGIAP